MAIKVKLAKDQNKITRDEWKRQPRQRSLEDRATQQALRQRQNCKRPFAGGESRKAELERESQATKHRQAASFVADGKMKRAQAIRRKD